MTNGEEILLVDDSQDDLDLTLHALRSEKLSNNIAIAIARDGEEALDYIFCRGLHAQRSRDQFPRLVLLDLKLPKVDGIEVLRQLKSNPHTRIIPVVILTSSKEDRDLVNSYNLGANSYIQKPVDFDKFRHVVKSLGLYWIVTNQRPIMTARAAKQGA